MGTTVATNALLNAKVNDAAVHHPGIQGCVRIATQARPRLFDGVVLPELLYERVAEVRERVGAHGEVIQALDERISRACCARGSPRAFAPCAIVFMHGYRYADHEARAAELARARGGSPRSPSPTASIL